MDILLLVLLAGAFIATAASLVTGLGAMAYGRRLDERHSHHLMAARVTMQGVAVLLVLLIVLTRLG
ncbi:hypothetical protein B1C78_13995 [Thioalkalivibrio denitrificans]|uniref:HIG1 domain-containing protein n=1 Tax=Thioalkalivibrio denitrificans TaxID=108003 RepID=A0A1V3NCN4_9GAMM|nr:HIG1 domain-containing protein [Thioalkalivibrio denitrificans]OOG22784.1 hypothetical protein B1C78_13995 [Thioalkalivibrio denitrificans]